MRRLPSFNLKGFFYRYGSSSNLCKGRISFCTWCPPKLSILICLQLTLFHSVYSSFYSSNYHPLLYLVFDTVLFNIDQVLPTTPLLMYLSRLQLVQQKDWLIYSGGFDRSGEFCYYFYISNKLDQIVNLPTCVPDWWFSLPLFWLYDYLLIGFALQWRSGEF